MTQTSMYLSKNNSPKTELANPITAEDTSLELTDASVLQSAPNLLTIGIDENAELVRYSAINGNIVSGLERGLNGTTASIWSTGTAVARNFSSYDADTYKSNIEDLASSKANTSDLGALASLDAVETSNITDGSVTSTKIADFSITSAKIANGTIINDDINASAAIAGTKIESGGITETQLADNSVITSKISANSVTNEKIAQASANTVKGNNTSSTANISDIEPDSLKAGTITEVAIPTIPQAGDTYGNIWGKLTGTINTLNTKIATPSTPLMDGTADIGTATMFANADHVHPSDTSRLPIISGAGFHNSIYRGKFLGTSVMAEQYAAIGANTFDDLFLGDYWTIGSVDYLIGVFNYYIHSGDTDLTTPHLTLFPRENMYNAVMNSTNTTMGGYVGSSMYTTGLTSAKNTIVAAFGSEHILTHRQSLVNAVSNGIPSAGAWFDSTVELMTEANVYGKQFGSVSDGTNISYNYSIDKSQYPIFAMRPDLQANRQTFWLRDTVSSAHFAFVNGTGNCDAYAANGSLGVRPAFSICA